MQLVSYTHHHSTLARFILLFAFLYAAFGVNSPFFPSFLSARGLEPEALGARKPGASPSPALVLNKSGSCLGGADHQEQCNRECERQDFAQDLT